MHWYFYIRLIINEFFEFVAEYYLGFKNIREFKILSKNFYLNGTFWGSKKNVSENHKF